MWQVLGGLIASFLLLRDIVGYVIPGAVLAGIIAVSSYDLSFLQKLVAALPQWFLIPALLVLCYVLGHILVAIGYAIYDVVDWAAGKPKAGAANPEPIYYRYLYPQLFIDADRRGTVFILRVGLPVALLVGAWGFPIPHDGRALMVGAGLILLINGYFGRAHIASQSAAALQAAKRAEANGIPPFSSAAAAPVAPKKAAKVASRSAGRANGKPAPEARA